MGKCVTNAVVKMHTRPECWGIQAAAVCLDWLLGKMRYENSLICLLSLIEPLILPLYSRILQHAAAMREHFSSV